MSDDPFRIRAHVPEFDAIVAEMVQRSAATREALAMAPDIAYGPGPSETLDLFFPPGERRALPVHLFIHGGYWRMFSKRDYSYVADTVTAAGAIAVIVDYALMPAVRMETIVDQMRRAREWIQAAIGGHGGDPARLTISGHSAGAHLATFLFGGQEAASGIGAALLLGGLYDLKPLQASFLQAEIGITDTEVEAFTPLARRHDPATRVDVLVGALETPPFHDQAARFSAHLEHQGLAVSRATLADRNHMDSVRDLGIATTEAGGRLAALIESSR